MDVFEFAEIPEIAVEKEDLILPSRGEHSGEDRAPVHHENRLTGLGGDLANVRKVGEDDVFAVRKIGVTGLGCGQ